jgi:hypothetical protein
MKKSQKPYWEMTTEELAEATKEYDKEFGGWDDFRPMTKAEREEYNRLVRRGRPKIGQGAQTVAISVEKNRLKKIDAFAKARGMSRSELLVSAAEKVIASEAARRAHRRAG